MSNAGAKGTGSLSNTLRQAGGSPEIDRFSATGGLSVMSANKNQSSFLQRDNAVNSKHKARVHIPRSWVMPLSLPQSLYESRYPHNHKSITYADAVVHLYAPYSQPDLRVKVIVKPATIETYNSYNTLHNDNYSTPFVSEYTEIHIFYAHRADKLRRLTVLLSNMENIGSEENNKNSEHSQQQQQQQQQQQKKEKNYFYLQHFQVVATSNKFERLHAWYDAGRVHDTIIPEGLRELIFVPEQRRVMKFYWRARDDGLNQRIEYFANASTLRKVKEFYCGRQDRLNYRSASFAAPQTMETALMHKMIVTGNVEALFAQIEANAPFTQLLDAITVELDPFRMSQRFERNEAIAANHDVSKTTFLRTTNTDNNKKNGKLTEARYTVSSNIKSKSNNTNNNNNTKNSSNKKQHPQNAYNGGAISTATGTENVNYTEKLEHESDGELWVYFHHDANSIIRPSHFFAKPSAGVAAYIAASNVLSEVHVEEPAVQITCMPGEVAPTELELHKERKWLAAMEHKCLNAIRYTMKEALVILYSLNVSNSFSLMESLQSISTEEHRDNNNNNIKNNTYNNNDVKNEEEEMKSMHECHGIASERIVPGENADLKPASFYTVQPVYSPYDTLRNRLHETEAQRKEKLAALRRQEESRKDYLAPYIAKVISADHFDGNYLTVSLTLAEATQVRDEALKELKERLIGRGRIMHERMDAEKETFKARQLSYQQSCESDAIDGSNEALEFARYAQEATWRMKVLEERLAKHIDEASEKYAALAKRLATDERLRILYKT